MQASSNRADITLIGLDDPESWEAAAQGGLPSQTWHYAWGLAAAGPAPELAVVRAGGARILLPFVRRGWRGHVDIATLPGLSGIRADPAALDAWQAHAVREGWVCGYLQLAAAPEEPTATAVAPAERLPGRLATHNALFVFDMARWDIATSVGRDTRRALRAGTRAGARLVTDRARLATVFPDLHRRTMARSGDAPAFGDETLARWFADPRATAFGAEIDGRIEAAFLGRARGAHAELHLAGASDVGRPLQGWLIWQAAEALRDAGHRWVNIGGYGHAGDGSHRMKRRLGALELPLRSLRQVYDPATYDRLTADAGCDPDTAYFPAYRAPAR